MKITFIRYLSKQDKINILSQGIDMVQLVLNEAKPTIGAQIIQDSLYDFQIEDSDIPQQNGTNITIETHVMHPDHYRQLYRNLKALSKFYTHSKEKSEILNTCISLLTGRPATEEEIEKHKQKSVYPDTSDMPVESSE